MAAGVLYLCIVTHLGCSFVVGPSEVFGSSNRCVVVGAGMWSINGIDTYVPASEVFSNLIDNGTGGRESSTRAFNGARPDDVVVLANSKKQRQRERTHASPASAYRVAG